MIDGMQDLKVFQIGEFKVLRSIDAGQWHMSISHPDRYPSWDEIKKLRYRLLPDDITMAIILPPKKEYVNIYENCFHLWQIPND